MDVYQGMQYICIITVYRIVVIVMKSKRNYVHCQRSSRYTPARFGPGTAWCTVAHYRQDHRPMRLGPQRPADIASIDVIAVGLRRHDVHIFAADRHQLEQRTVGAEHTRQNMQVHADQ